MPTKCMRCGVAHMGNCDDGRQKNKQLMHGTHEPKPSEKKQLEAQLADAVELNDLAIMAMSVDDADMYNALYAGRLQKLKEAVQK